MQNGHATLQERGIREAQIQRSEEEEQAEAALPSPEPAQRSPGLTEGRPVKTERYPIEQRSESC